MNDEWINAVKSYGRARLALALGVSPQAISQWSHGPPPRRALEVERLLGVSRHVLRPDVFGPPPRHHESGSANAA